MNILWLSWKDLDHPLAGGAEVVKSQICRRLTANGHSVTLITSRFPGSAPETVQDGCRVIRVGNMFTVYWHAWRYYRERLRGWANLVVDECNTVPFFARLYVSEPVVMVIHQLARNIWFYQMQWPLSWAGYLLEPCYLKILKKSRVITISESTRNELIRFGFCPKKIQIMGMGSDFEVVEKLDNGIKFEFPTLLYLGSIRDMKRPDHIVKAYLTAKEQIPELRLVVAGFGDGKYFEQFMRLVEKNNQDGHIQCVGRVSDLQKKHLMRSSHLIAVSSVKEGWGLIVTEAAGQGTPAVVYDADGLRDSVKNGETGLVTNPSPDALAKGIICLINNQKLYLHCQKNAWNWARVLNFDNTYADFCKILMIH